ncbi:Retrovirus-related Pol polyprotein from transposon [Smittium culicis]|uniref:Retrovirus-related Pol polyprotein from transposon n=1 Tax=Smittium culicis TaxID=133412 RepID=A0A1R1YNX0_9FUNG|nr:Retrovirus-related Pol polyprotein from transposon [Smittium culicis]
MKLRCWWSNMRLDILNFIKSCPICQIVDTKSGTIAPLNPLSPAKTAFSRWGIDFIGQLPTTQKGNKWIILAIDHQTNWIVASATSDAKADTVIKFLHEKIFLQFGSPKEIISDRGTQFTSDLMKKYLETIGVKHNLTSSYHPMANGKTERANGVIGRALTKLSQNHKTKWDLFLDQAVWATRVRQHSVTKVSPYFLVYGIDPRLPGDQINPFLSHDYNQTNAIDETSKRLITVTNARIDAREEQLTAANKMKAQYNKNANETKYPLGSWVLIKNETKKKLDPNFLGPFKVVYYGPFHTYKLETVNGMQLKTLVNHNRLRQANVSSEEKLKPWTKQPKSKANGNGLIPDGE